MNWHISSKAVVIFLTAFIPAIAGCQSLSKMMSKTKRAESDSSHLPGMLRSVYKPVSRQQKADVQMTLAQAMERNGQSQQAITAYEEVIRNDSTRGDAHHRLAVLYLKKGDTRVAEEHFQAAIEATPENAELLCDMGYCDYLQRRWDEAEKKLNQALKLNPELERAHNNLGLIYARAGRQDQALHQFVRGGCRESEARTNVAQALMMEGRLDEASQQLRLAMADDKQPDQTKLGLETLRSIQTRTAGRAPSAPPVLRTLPASYAPPPAVASQPDRVTSDSPENRYIH